MPGAGDRNRMVLNLRQGTASPGSVLHFMVSVPEGVAEHDFLDEQAGQCGYCLSGILISAKALLDRNPNPDRAEVVAALDKQLCRCGAHQRILRAVERAAAALRGGSRS